MINLLSLQEKAEIVWEDKRKIILNLEVIFLIFFICFALVLFIIKAFIFGELEVHLIQLSQKQEEFEDYQLQNFESEIISSNKKIVQLDSFYKTQFSFTGTLEKISGLLPAQTYLTGIIFTQPTVKEEGQLIQVSLSGFAPDRNILVELKNNLESEVTFTEFTFPSSNWLSATDINFSLTFKVK